ncbi:MAG: hypothetical protein R6U96_15820 [Promethearchaeia archaeon]
MKKKVVKLLLLILHWIIILNFAFEIFYGAYQVFFALATETTGGALFGRATDISYELMVTRRLYAIETWIAIAGLAIYLAITEIRPRLKELEEK